MFRQFVEDIAGMIGQGCCLGNQSFIFCTVNRCPRWAGSELIKGLDGRQPVFSCIARQLPPDSFVL